MEWSPLSGINLAESWKKVNSSNGLIWDSNTLDYLAKIPPESKIANRSLGIKLNGKLCSQEVIQIIIIIFNQLSIWKQIC